MLGVKGVKVNYLSQPIRGGARAGVGFMVLHSSLIYFTEELYIEALQALGSLEQVVCVCAHTRYQGCLLSMQPNIDWFADYEDGCPLPTR